MDQVKATGMVGKPAIPFQAHPVAREAYPAVTKQVLAPGVEKRPEKVMVQAAAAEMTNSQAP